MNRDEPFDLQPSVRSLSAPDIEATVLSILLSFPDCIDDAGQALHPNHFVVALHRAIFVELRRQFSQGLPVDAMSVAQQLDGLHSLAEVLEVARYNDFSSRAITRHVRTLVDLHQARSLHALSGRMAELAFSDGPIAERIDLAQSEVAKLQQHDAEDDWVDAHRAAIEHLDLLDARNDGKVSGMPSGFSDLDDLLDGGFACGNLVVVGARPGMGKSAIGMSIGLHMASTYSVGMLSMEMPHNDIRDRQAAIIGRIPIASIKRPKHGAGLDFSRIVDGVERSKTLRWYVSDRSSLNILQLRSMARALRRRNGLDVLIVDYIGLMAGLDPKQPRAYQIEEISRGLKSLAKELDLVVLCLAQVNRGAAEKAMSPPSLHELRDSGAIEQDADVVMFLHRPIQANPNAGAQWTNYAQLRVAKNRQGRCGDVHLFFHGEYTGFEGWGGEPPNTNSASHGAKPARRGMQESGEW